MSELARRRAFLAAAAALGGAALLIAAIGRAPHARPLKPGPARRLSPLVAAAPADSPDSPSKRRGGSRTRRAAPSSARHQARSFLRGFLLYQQRAADSRARALIGASAGPHVRRYLAGLPPRLGRVKRQRLAALHLYGPHRHEVKASALLAYGRERSLFEFLLRRRGGGWRVTELYP
jgi:hypothetical protein